MVLAEVGNLVGFIAFMFFLWFGPPILLTVLGFFFRNRNKKTTSKALFILAFVYMLVGGGICSALIG